MPRHASLRAGFTVVETVIALALVGLVLTKLMLVVDEARHAQEEEGAAMQLDDQAMDLLDRIAFAIIGSAREKIAPTQFAPLTSERIQFQVSLGIEDGKVVWSDPEAIGLEEQSGQVYWSQNEGEVNERRVVWANTVSTMLEDELLNGVDDNGNDLADELGLSFVLDGDSVMIKLSLEREREKGKRIQVTKETVVTCRN